MLSLSSEDDAKKGFVDAIDLMSLVNDDYISISVAKDEAMNKLKKTMKAAKKKQVQVEEQIHNCQIHADNNLAEIPDEFDPKGLKFLPLDEGEMPEVEMTEAEKIEFRMRHDIERMPQLREAQANLEQRQRELKDQLNEARAVYGKILNKMRVMYDTLVSFSQDK